VSILVAGLEPLGIAIVRRLIAAGEDVRVLAPAAEVTAYAHELAHLGVPASVGAARSPGELEAAGLREAHVLVLTADDDAQNVDAALTARRLRADIPLVVRIFDPALGTYLEETEAGMRVMSVSGIAAPRYADLALQAIEKETLEAGRAAERARRPAIRRRLRRPVDPLATWFAIAALVVVVVAVAFFALELRVGWLDSLYFVT